jgi:hypothetical protein
MEKASLGNHINWFRCTCCKQPLNPFEELPQNCPEHKRLLEAMQKAMETIGQAFFLRYNGGMTSLILPDRFPRGARGPKYNNIITEYKGFKYDSYAEAKYAWGLICACAPARFRAGSRTAR